MERLLKDEVHKTRRSFKEVLNDAIRQGLRPPGPNRKRRSFAVDARPMGLRTGIDPARLTEMADDLEVEAFLKLTRQLERKNR